MTVPLPLPPYLKGKNILAQSITPATASGSAVLTLGTAVDMKTLGIIDTWSFKGSFGGFEKHPTDGTFANYVGTVDDFDFQLGEIERADAPSVLMALWMGYNFARFECDVADDTGTLIAKFAIIATRAGGTIDKGIVEGENGVIMSMKPCGIAPYYGNSTPPF